MTVEGQVTTLLINGTVGSGKSTAADAVGQLLATQDVPHAVIDLDALRRAWPAPADDPFNSALELENLRAVAATYRRVGAQRLVLAGVLEQPALRRRYSAAVGTPLTVVRLRAPVSTILNRLRSRHVDDAGALDWHLARCAELHAILEGAGVDDAVVDVSGSDRRQVAEAVMEAAGWSR
jgi:predicted kinase